MRLESKHREEIKSSRELKDVQEKSLNHSVLVEKAEENLESSPVAASFGEESKAEGKTDSLKYIETKKSLCLNEQQLSSGELLKQFIGEKLAPWAFFEKNDEDYPLLEFTPSEKSSGRQLSVHRSSEELANLITEEVFHFLVEEALLENQDIQFRNQICPEDSHLQVDSGDEFDLSNRKPKYAIRTNQHAIAEFLTLLVEFIMENYSEIVVQKFNAGLDVSPHEVIKHLREKEILLYACDEDTSQMGGYSEQEKDTLDSLLQFDQPLLLDVTIFKSLRSEVMVDIVKTGHFESFRRSHGSDTNTRSLSQSDF